MAVTDPATTRPPRTSCGAAAPHRIKSPFRHPGADRGGPVDLAAARRILVVRPDNIGDVVLLTPALRALRRPPRRRGSSCWRPPRAQAWRR